VDPGRVAELLEVVLRAEAGRDARAETRHHGSSARGRGCPRGSPRRGGSRTARAIDCATPASGALHAILGADRRSTPTQSREHN
jgi:hypothetical protein